MGRLINNTQQANKNPLEDLCCEIYQGDYVLVIGNDAILREDLEGGGNNRRFFDYQVDEYLKEQGVRTETIDERKDKISEFLKNEWAYDVEAEVNEDLVRLLQTKCFRVVINTTFDGYLEALMRQVWGDELRVINIYDTRDKTAFGNYAEFDLVQPTLIYAMGKADSAVAKFAYTEDNVIELIATRWLESTKRPNDLINYIRGQKVLGIGCKLDDWEFRFFWYSLRQDLSRLHGEVAISLDTGNSESDRKLAQYLQRKNVRDKGNSREFLHALQTQLNDPNKYVYERLQQRLQVGGVFISYAKEDFLIACQVNKLLQDHGCKVWFDNRQLLGGDTYDDRIANAIRECRVFIPLLGAQASRDLENGTERYYQKERELVSENMNCGIIPLTLYGFEIKEKRDLLPPHIRNKSAICWRKDGTEALLTAVKDKLSK